MRKAVYFALILSCYNVIIAQSGLEKFLTPSDTLNSSRQSLVKITEGSLAGLTLLGLNQLWYKDFARTSFQTVNDNDEWLQIDKVGHVYSAYHLTRLGAETLSWSGASKNQQLIYGSFLSLGFLTAVEVFDGFSEEWGFSWGDFTSNLLGTGFYVGQELLWNEQRLKLKFSFHQTRFASQNPEKLGNGFLEELLKDYNGQTYWLSANLHSFFKQSKLPKWLNLAVGYGGEGMLTGNSNSSSFFANQDRNRLFYLSLDVDLTKIRTKSKLLSTVFSVVNVLKIPAPTLEFTGKSGIVFHLLYY